MAPAGFACYISEFFLFFFESDDNIGKGRVWKIHVRHLVGVFAWLESLMMGWRRLGWDLHIRN